MKWSLSDEADLNDDGIDYVDDSGAGGFDFRFLTVPIIDMKKKFALAVGFETFQLHLENGDIITGEMIRMENQKLVFKTDYAGEISVDWKKIVKLITEDPIKVILSDGSILEGFTGYVNEDFIEAEDQDFGVRPRHSPISQTGLQESRINNHSNR